MIDFFGNNLLHDVQESNGTMNMAQLFNLSSERADLLAKELTDKKVAHEQPKEGKTHFSIGEYISSLELELQSPEECLFVGLCIGRFYGAAETEMKHLLEKMLSDPKKMAELFMKVMMGGKGPF